MNKSKLKANEIDWKISKQYNLRFGQIAVEKGYVTPEQVKQGLMEQLDDDFNNRPHRVIGIILFDNRWMTPYQIEEVLIELFNGEKEDKQKEPMQTQHHTNLEGREKSWNA